MIDFYNDRVNRITRNEFLYVAVTPETGLKSLAQFKYLIKKSMRDFSKLNDVTHSHQYLEYVSLIEVNSSITKGYNLLNGKFPKRKIFDTTLGKAEVLYEPRNPIDEMGYHTHIFLGKTHSCKDVSRKALKQVWIKNFDNNGIRIDWYETSSEKVASVKRFVGYHTKQLNKLDNSFVITNV